MNRYMKLSGFAAALVAAALFGAVALNTASAQTWVPPIPSWMERPTPVPQAPAEEPVGGLFGEDTGEAIVCSMDGCEVPIVFVTADGGIAKRLVITLEDPEADETPTAE